MIRSAKSQTKLSSTVQIFSSLVEMRFKPLNENGVQTLNKRKEKLVKANKEYLDIYDPLSMVLQADRKIELQQLRRLKFVASLSADHFIVGNQNQIDLISFGAISHGFVDTEYYWSLTLKEPIESITVDVKKCIFVLLSNSIAYFYRYNIKTKEPPVVVTEIALSQRVRFIRFLKDMLLGFFYSTRYEIFNIENLNAIKKKLDKSYPIGKEKKLLTIPPSIDNIINVFFQEPKENKQSFILWCLELNFQGEQIRSRQLYRVYDIMNYVKGKLSIQNYTKDIIFMNLKNQIMAIKNGYLIDTVNVSVNEQGEILKYIHPQTILHITKKNVQVYNFSIDMTVKPEKILLKSIDSIELCNVPQNAFYITVLQTVNNNFAIFFQDSEKKKFQSRGEITYYFQISQTTTLKQKISSLFDSISLAITNPEVLQEKYNMAKKMGLTQKEIYLEIWNRSNKSTLEDYQYILATRDYKTIKIEIEKKLKKESMKMRQILRIEQGCLDINRQKIENPNPTEEDFQDYVTSHFLMRKLKLYKEINVLDRLSSILNSEDSSGQNKSLKIDIQHYYTFKNADVKSFLLDQIGDMLFNFKNNAKIIRVIIKHFKFTYRLIYKQLLEEIIKASKDQIINLLNEIPEILPYIHRDLNDEQLKSQLYDGIWGQIRVGEWDEALLPDRIENLHNKHVLSQFVKSLWFKRYWLTSHDMVNKTKNQIIEINQVNNSEIIFYFFISKVYQLTKSNKTFYYQIVNFLQEKYELFPSHLRNKAFLYENLYIYYYHQEISNPNKLNFAQFLQLDDQHLFKYFFDHEKVKKNSLLKQIKPIYEQSDPNGSHVFNIGLFSYFYSDLSKISDLKFILNRINNEKSQFHQKNFGIYEVLVKSMQLKLKLGGQNSIPMDQVMIYIQSIPLDRNNEIMLELYVMESIKEEAQRFNEMKINMSVKEIMESCDLVIGKIITYEIKKRKITSISNWKQFRQETFKLLEQVQNVKRKIYHNQQSISLLVYLCTILQSQNQIGFVAQLLEDNDLHQTYNIDEKNVENIVLYMYKLTLSKNPVYVNSQSYLKKLLQLLSHENQCRIFLQSQLELAVMLSSPEVPIRYPISKAAACPRVKDLQQIFKQMKKEYILNINPQLLFELFSKLEKIAFDKAAKSEDFTSLHKIYEIFIVALLEKKLYIQTIPHIYKILDIEPPLKDGNIIYVIIFVYRIADEFNEQSKRCIFKLVSLLFYEPATIMKTIQFSMRTKLTGLQQTKHLREILIKESEQKYNYNHQNAILSRYFCQNYKKPSTKQIIEYCRGALKSSRQDLQRKNQYDLIFTILCQQPYLLAKFIDLERHHLQLKTLQMFILTIGNREIFHPVRTFETMKRIFAALSISGNEGKEVSHIIKNFQTRTVEEEYQLPKLSKLESEQKEYFNAALFFAKSANNTKKKYQSQSIEAYRTRRIQKMKKYLENPNAIVYDRVDLEEIEDNQQEKEKIYITKEVKPNQLPFDSLQQRQLILKRVLPFNQFIQGKQFLPSQKQQQEAVPQVPKLLLKTNKDSNYLNIRNSMIEQLYSHKIVNKSENNEDLQTRKADQDFLDSFLPNKMEPKDSHCEIKRLESKQSQLESKLSNRLNQIDKQKQVQHLVKVIDEELGAEHNIQIGNYNNIEPQAVDENNLFEKILEQIISTYNEHRIPKFQLLSLEQQLQKLIDELSEEEATTSQRKYQQFIADFVKYVYNRPVSDKIIYLKLLQEIARKHPESNINIFFLQAYERIYSTHEKYGLNLEISSILPISGVFIKSKDIFDLYLEVEPFILPKITDQNIFKLSKLIALGFRKNVVEQQILMKYSKRLMFQFTKVNEDEKAKQFEKIRCLWQKIPPAVLVDKAEDFFQGVQQGQRRNLLLNSFLQSLKNKGYVAAARDLTAKLIP